jgi:CubicO group peptidase (beta-lactamase class C family)
MRHCLPLFLLALPAAAQETRPADVHEYLARCAAFGWSGTALVVHEGELVLHAGFGAADVETGLPNGPETLFELASTTKPFTACAILALVEDGALELDDPIAAHLPGVPEDKRGITVRHLLCHASGMPRRATGGHGDDLGRAVAAYLAGPAARAPGEASEYWNGGYALLAGIVRTVSGKSYEDYCRERLFARAGLEHTGFTGDALPRALQAVGYDAGAPVRRAAEHPYGSYGYQYLGMGGLVTSSTELRRFLAAYEQGAVLAAETTALMETTASEPYGLGWAVTRTARGTRRIGHGGDVRGFHNYLLRFPDEDSLVIVLSNVGEVPMWKLAWNVEALLFDQPLRVPAPPAVAAWTADELGGLAGEYASEDGARLALEVDASGLHVAGDPFAAPASDALEASVELARTLLAAVRAGDPGPVRAVLAAHIPPGWPDALCEELWPAHVQRHGEPERVELLGARDAGRGTHEVLLGLGGGARLQRLKVVLRAGELLIFDLDGPRSLVRLRLAPVAEDALVGFDWAADRASGALRVEREEGVARALVVERPGAKARRYRRLE